MQKKEKSDAFRTSIGGQALIEGILMRGPKKQAIVVRKPDGELEKTSEDLKLVKDRYPILGWPLVRGVVNFFSSLINGVKALTYSASFLPEEEQEEPSKFDKWVEKKFGMEKAEKILIGVAVFVSVVFSIVLFVILPNILTGLLTEVLKYNILCNLVEGAIRICIFLAYLILCSRLKDIKRVFEYHGAEHKTIFCYEKGLPLTVENVRIQQKEHPRCGTSFLFVVMIISILVFSVVSWSNKWIRMLLRIVLLPVVVAISYELNRWVGRHDNVFTRILSAPGRWMQKFTTRQPDDSMIEVAIAALEMVIPEEKGSDKW